MPDLGESSSGKAELGDDESNLGYRSDERSSKPKMASLFTVEACQSPSLKSIDDDGV